MSLTGPRRSARLAHRAIVRCGNTDRNADSPPLKEMAGVNHISKKKKFKAVVASSSRRKTRSSIPFLPEGIIFNILVLLPAEILYNVMRYVCREWYNVINSPEFINAHLQQSTNGLLIQRWKHPEVIHFVEIINNWDVRITNLRYEFSNPICASCDGLVLFEHDSNDFIFCVANLITNQIVTLPPLSEPIRDDALSALIYVHSIRRYKVVHVFIKYCSHELMCAILTVGTETAWRLIDTKHIPYTESNLDLFESEPLSAGGYLYWTPDSGASSNLLALDVEAEIMRQLPNPKVFNEKGGFFIVRESFLALMVSTRKILWEVWVLTELNTGEWTRLYNIDLTAQRGMLNRMLDAQKCSIPVAWLRNGELVIFRDLYPSTTYIAYNIKTRELSSFTMEKNERCFMNYYHAHVNSLVSLKVR